MSETDLGTEEIILIRGHIQHDGRKKKCFILNTFKRDFNQKHSVCKVVLLLMLKLNNICIYLAILEFITKCETFRKHQIAGGLGF